MPTLVPWVSLVSSSPAPGACFASLHVIHLEREYSVPEPSEKDVMNRAYEIWERHGRPEGREDEFWALAQQELRNEDKSNPMRTPDTL